MCLHFAPKKFVKAWAFYAFIHVKSINPDICI